MNLRRVFGRSRRRRRIGEHFSSSFYLSQFPEVERLAIKDPLEHFLLYWKQNGYDPSPLFSMNNYLIANPDVEVHGINPLVHYVEKGIAESRPLWPMVDAGQTQGLEVGQFVTEIVNLGKVWKEQTVDLAKYLDSLDFEYGWEPTQVDPGFYRLYFPSETIIDCDRHYDQVGWKMGLNPTEWFNTKFYLAMYPDIDENGMNPFLHFVIQGYKEFRIPSDSHYRNFVQVLKAPSIEIDARSWVDATRRTKLVDLPTFTQQIVKTKIENGPLVVSIGHSKYLSDVGGIQLYTFVEAQKFNQIDINYLHISPSRQLPLLAEDSLRDLCVNMTFNNVELLGDVLLSDLIEIVSVINSGVPPIAFIVQSLYGWSPELLNPIIDQLSSDQHFWIFHDYSTFCSNSTLSFENASSCGNPKIGSGICSTCRFGQIRNQHVSRIKRLLDSRDWRFVAPSISTSGNIMKFLALGSSQVSTIPHGQLQPSSLRRTFQPKPRIAFVGHPVMTKGWFSFLNFVDLGLKDFDFYHFGSVDSEEPGIQFFPLVNDFRNLDQSRDLLIENEIDAVFICPTWEETFCFVVYEALAAGCQIICSAKSGNVVDAALGNAIPLGAINTKSVAQVKTAVIKAREAERFVSDFVFSGTIANEYCK